MHKVRILLLLILPVIAVAQESDHDKKPENKTVLQASHSGSYEIEDAELMAADGEYVFISYGIAPAYNPDFNNYVFENYGIKVISRGCVTSAKELATAAAFKKEIDDKYGKYFLPNEFKKIQGS